MKLKVASANFYVGNKQPEKDAKLLESLGCDLVGIQEGHSGNAPRIRKSIKKNYRVFWGKRDSKDLSLAMLDVPIAVNRKFKIKRLWAVKVSNRAQAENIGMARAATAVRFRRGKYKVTFINTHLNAAVQSRTTKKPLSRSIKRVSEYVSSMRRLNKMIKRAQKRGDMIILTGDLNFSKDRSGFTWRYSPQALFKRRNLDYRAGRIDYIAFSPEFKCKPLQVIDKSRTGSDHDWLTIELETRI